MGHARTYQLRGAGGSTLPAQPQPFLQLALSGASTSTLAGATTLVATKFTLPAAHVLLAGSVWVYRTGTQSGLLVSGIFSDSAGAPGDLLYRAVPRAFNDLPTGGSWFVQVFEGPRLSAGTLYWHVFGRTPGAGVITYHYDYDAVHTLRLYNGAWMAPGVGYALSLDLSGY